MYGPTVFDRCLAYMMFLVMVKKTSIDLVVTPLTGVTVPSMQPLAEQEMCLIIPTLPTKALEDSKEVPIVAESPPL